QSPWWLTLLRMLLSATIILAIADPVFNPLTSSLASGGPLVLFVDNSWAAAAVPGTASLVGSAVKAIDTGVPADSASS
ncbi:hypothetical protein ACC692_38800, partial [Rhizobium ruizarguesonis]